MVSVRLYREKMIQNLDINKNCHFNNTPRVRHSSKNTKEINFGGFGDVLTAGLQACERHPMIGVSAIDAATCIIPRAAVDFNTNTHAGLETLRRESSGLLVNCLLPSYFVMGVAGFLQYVSLPKEYRNIGLVTSWADEDTIKKLASHYVNPKGLKSANYLANSEDDKKVGSYVRSVLSDLEGFNSNKGQNWVKYSDYDGFDDAINLLTKAIKGEVDTKQAITNAYKLLSDGSKATETIRFSSDSGKNFNSNLSAIIRDLVDLGKQFSKPEVSKNIDKYIDTAIRFVKQKSFAGLAIVLPLAASMQYINRWITRKKSGIKGAPIYRDFGTEPKNSKKQDKSLWVYKLAGAGTIMGLAIASMMKKPNWKMFQFKGLFPTLDQARWIAAITFASRVLAAEDKNEVRESTFRDAAGFASLYFLGDYVAKVIATVMNKTNPSVELINKHKIVDENAGWFKKFGNWMKNYSLKSFDEVPKELKTKRGICQAASLGASMLLLGLFIPIWNRKQTEKNREKELQEAKNNKDKESKQSIEGSKVENKMPKPELNPYANGPESTMSLLWHAWVNPSFNRTFCGFEEMTNFK